MNYFDSANFTDFGATASQLVRPQLKSLIVAL